MILMLAKKQGTSAEYVRGVIWSQRSHFRCLEVDWRRVVDESIECNLPVVMFVVLVEASVSRRSICMSAEHQIEINQRLLTDHFYDTGIYKVEWKFSKYWKTNHPFMGKMSFSNCCSNLLH